MADDPAVGVVCDACAAHADLFRSLADGHDACVSELVRVQPERVQARNPMGRSPLCVAALTRNGPMVAMLLGAGAAVTVRDAFGTEPLHCAATGGDADCVRLLLAAGANVDAKSNSGNTPLHAAAQANQPAAVAALGAAGANLDLTNRQGRTAVQIAGVNKFGEVLAAFKTLQREPDYSTVCGFG